MIRFFLITAVLRPSPNSPLIKRRKKQVNRSDEGLKLETSVFSLLTVTNLRYQLSCSHKLPAILFHRRSTTVSLETHPVYSFIQETVTFRREASKPVNYR